MNQAHATVHAKTMKILQVIPYFNPKFGGDVNVCYNLSTQLAKNGHDVTIITTDYRLDTDFVREIEMNGVSVIPFRTILSFGLFLFTPSINSWLEENVADFEIIHMHNYRSYQNNRVSKFARKKCIPYLLQPHGAIMPFSEKILLKNLYDFVWGDTLSRNASKVLVLNTTEADQCSSKGILKEAIEIIPNGIDLTEFVNLPPFGEFRKKYNIPLDSQVVLYIGRLHRSKGLDLLIDAFGELNKTRENTLLIVIGPDDGYHQHILQKIADLYLENYIRLIGYISHEEKIQAYVDSDVFVTPSFSGFPVTFLEACACGVPIITTCKGDDLGWIDNNVGLVVAYEKSQIQEAMEKILNNDEVSLEFRANGIDLVKSTYNWEKISDDLEKLYSNLVQEG